MRCAFRKAQYTPRTPTRLNSTVASRRRRRCVLGINTMQFIIRVRDINVVFLRSTFTVGFRLQFCDLVVLFSGIVLARAPRIGAALTLLSMVRHQSGDRCRVTVGLHIGVGAQSTLRGLDIFARKYMYEKLTKFPNFT